MNDQYHGRRDLRIKLHVLPFQQYVFRLTGKRRYDLFQQSLEPYRSVRASREQIVRFRQGQDTLLQRINVMLDGATCLLRLP